MPRTAIAIVVLLAATRFVQAWPPAVEAALEKAGDNCKELETVLTHYRDGDDPLKQQAAEFLIANMDGHGFVEHTFYDADGDEITFDALEYRNYKEARSAFETLEQEHGSINYGRKRFVADLETITADFLIDNIDVAFEAWRSKPWAKDISYEVFCDYILPYRGSNEPLEPWRGFCLERLADLSAKLETTTTDPAEAARKIRKRSKKWVKFSELYYLHPTDQGFSEMLDAGRGRCEDMSNMMGYAMRAHAVVSACDYTPYWPHRDNNHAWEVLLDADGSGSSGDGNRAAKVYRKIFAIQPDSLGAIKHAEEKVPRWLSGRNYIDVTTQYKATTDVSIELVKPIPDGARFAYLAVFNGGEWKAIHWAGIEDGRVTFTAMGRGIVYLPTYYVDEELLPAAAPFILDKEGDIRRLSGLSEAIIDIDVTTTKVTEPTERTTIVVKLAKPHELFVWDDGWQSLGTRQAGPEPATYEAVPADRLYWLVAEDSRRLERIFTIEDGHRAGW